MARPSISSIDNGVESWEADINDNFDILVDGPFPLKQYANSGAFPAAASYENCIAVAQDNDKIYISDGASWNEVGAVESFTDLSDVPASYAGQAGKILRVNGGETALEFVEESGGSGSVTVYSKKLSRWEGYTTGSSVDQDVAWIDGDQLNSFLNAHGALANDAWDNAPSTMAEMDRVRTLHGIMALNGDFDETDTYFTDGRIDFSNSALRTRMDGTSNTAQMRTDGYDGTGSKGKSYFMGVDDSAASIAGDGHLHFSTSEQKTGVNWVDGRAIYCKTVNTGAVPNSTSASTAHGISGILEVVHIEAVASEESPGPAHTLPHSKTTDGFAVYVDENYITLDASWTTNWADSDVTIYYTKEDASTPLEDASEAALGENRGVDFSFDEHEAGFDVDGNTIYRKVVDFGALPNSTTKEILHGILGFKELIKIEGCCYKSSGDVGWYRFPLVYSSSPYGSVLTVDREKVSIQSNADESDWESGYIVLYYKKMPQINSAKSKPVITGDVTIYVDSSGNDLTGDGTSASPFASLEQAFETLDNFRIAKQATVTIDVEDGTYSSVASFTISHPDGERINVQGDTTSSTGTAITGTDSGAKTFTVAGDVTGLFPSGSVCHVMGSTNNDSSYTVVSSSFGGGNTTITVSESPHSNTADGTIYDCPSSYNCIFEMAASSTITVESKLGQFSGICIEGNATPGNGLLVSNKGRIDSSSNLVIRDCAIALYIEENSSFYGTTTVLHKNDSYSLYITSNSIASITEGLQACHNGSHGIMIGVNSSLVVGVTGSGDTHQHLVCSNNTGTGIDVTANSSLIASYSQVIDNGGNGLYSRNSFVSADHSLSMANTGINYYANVGTRMYIPYALSYDAGSDGMKAIMAFVYADNATSSNNGSYGVYATSGAHIIFTSGSATGNTTADYSPAVNAVGNENAYIDT